MTHTKSLSAAFLLVSLWPGSMSAKTFRPGVDDMIDRIGSTRPYCRKEFEAKFPERKAEVGAIADSVLLLTCGDHRGSAVYVDTPSKRVLLSVEHIVSNYRFDKDKIVLGDVTDPGTCFVHDPVTHEKIGIDKRYPVKLGHPLRSTSMDGTTDWMVLVLRKPLDAKPLPMASDRFDHLDALAVGAISYPALAKPPCMVFVVCQSRYVHRPPGKPTFYKTDCSSGRGASGGPLVVKDGKGVDVVAAVMNGTTKDLPDGSPFDKDKMYQGSAAIDSTFLKAVLETEAEIAGAPMVKGTR